MNARTTPADETVVHELSSTVTAETAGPDGRLSLWREDLRGGFACISLTSRAEESLLELLVERASRRGQEP